MDPFAATSDPDAYVQRPACERVLAELERELRGGRRVLVLSGPPGLGKTLLLRVLEQRLAGFARALFLPYAAFAWDDFCRYALGLAGESLPENAAPEDALCALVRADARPLVLLVDDASALPPDVARRLGALVEALGGTLRLVAVPVDDGRAGGVIAALGEDVAHARLREPMSAGEVRAYVEARLAGARASAATRERLGPPVVAWLHRESGGNPRVLHALASWVLHPEAGPPDLGEKELDLAELDLEELE